jgi:hypothetical protein
MVISSWIWRSYGVTAFLKDALGHGWATLRNDRVAVPDGVIVMPWMLGEPVWAALLHDQYLR